MSITGTTGLPHPREMLSEIASLLAARRRARERVHGGGALDLDWSDLRYRRARTVHVVKLPLP